MRDSPLSLFTIDNLIYRELMVAVSTLLKAMSQLIVEFR